MGAVGFLRSFLAVTFFALLGGDPASAQSVTATIPAGDSPRGIAVNPATNKVYVVNELSNDVTIIDGATNATATVAVGPRPQYIAANPSTNRIYVSNGGNSSQSVIDGATRAVTPLPTGGNGPFVVNPATNKAGIPRWWRRLRWAAPASPSVTRTTGFSPIRSTG